MVALTDEFAVFDGQPSSLLRAYVYLAAVVEMWMSVCVSAQLFSLLVGAPDVAFYCSVRRRTDRHSSNCASTDR